jgi:hypothetical protein
MKPWFNTVDWWYENNQSSISLPDLYDVHMKVFNPVALQKQKDLIAMQYAIVQEVTVNPDVVGALIQEQYRQEKYASWAEQLIELSRGADGELSLDKLSKEIATFDMLRPASKQFEPAVISADDMLNEALAQGRWKFHLAALRDKVGGIGAGVFTLIAARPEVGKSLFAVSCCFHPEGWAAQGAKIFFLGNEEKISRTKYRAVLCHAGMDSRFAKQNPDRFREAAADFEAKYIATGQVIFYHQTGMDYRKIEELLIEHTPDILIIDQLDKLAVAGNGEKLDKLEAIYTTMREHTVNYNCAIIGVSQASDLASGKKFFGYECLENSRTRKAAELDLCICIGRERLDEDNFVRYINLAKNKLTGNENGGTLTYMINPQTSRMED